MTTINLREFFYWYKVDEFISVTEEVAAELRADKSYEVNHWRRMKRNKANYSLDAGDGIEHEICEHEPSPEEFMAITALAARLNVVLCEIAEGNFHQAMLLAEKELENEPYGLFNTVTDGGIKSIYDYVKEFCQKKQ